MTLLKRLVFREWIKAFLASFFILFLLILVANIVSELLRAVADFPLIMKHTILELPKWIHKILPISCLTAGIFSVNSLQSKNELMAMFSVGLSKVHFLGVVFQLAVIVAIFEFFVGAYLTPFGKKMRKTWMKEDAIHFRSNKAKGVKTTALSSGRVWFKGEDKFISFVGYDKRNEELRRLNVYYIDPSKNQIFEIIEGKKARGFKESTEWELNKGRHFRDLGGKAFPRIRSFEKLRKNFNERPSDFREIDSDITTLSFHQLESYIGKLDELNINASEYKVIYYDKIASAIICVIFSLLAIRGINNPGRRQSNFGGKVVFVLVFTILYWLAYSSFMALGQSDKLSPAVAVLFIPSLCSLFVFFSFYRNRILS